MARTKVIVNLPDDASYNVRIGTGLLADVGAHLREVNTSSQTLIITDSNVAPFYLQEVKDSLIAAGYRTAEIVIPAGEASKSLACMAEIWEAMAQLGLTRESLVVGLGGGVVGDIAGFAASTFMRGIACVQLPTSLLAMVDASVGGKTGVNLEAGKNLVGTFKQPLYVCAATETLDTLPEEEWTCGCAEIAKAAVVDSDEFFFWLSEAAAALSARESKVTLEALTRSVIFKANIVGADTLETKGVRECLNYGHTLGHALETCAGFGTYSHGQAVAEGMRFAARLGVALAGASAEFVRAQDELLDALGLPSLGNAEEPEELLEAMHKDKKSQDGAVRFVLLRDVGQWGIEQVDDETILEHLQAWKRSKE